MKMRIFCLYDNMKVVSRRSGNGRIPCGDQAEGVYLPDTRERGMLFEDVKGNLPKGTIPLMKNTWGFMPISIETEGRFSSKPSGYYDEDFVGNNYEVEYLVRRRTSQAGRNYSANRFT